MQDIASLVSNYKPGCMPLYAQRLMMSLVVMRKPVYTQSLIAEVRC